MKTQNLWKPLVASLKKHSPEILTGLGIAGMFGAVVTAVHATPKVISILNRESEKRMSVEKPTDMVWHEKKQCYMLPVKDVLKLSWKYYIPTASILVASAGCIIGANTVNFKRQAALTLAYNLSERAFHEYKEKTVQTLGEKKEAVLRDSIAQDHLDKTPLKEEKVIVNDRAGDVLCLDFQSGRYFKTSIEKLRKMENELNKRMLSEDYITLNDFYYSIGLDSIGLGDSVGWDLDHGMMDLAFSSLIKDDKPCLVLEYEVVPLLWKV